MKRLAIAAVGLVLLAGIAMVWSGGTSANGGNSITVPDGPDIVGEWNSVALDGDGNPVISYYSQTNDDLKVLHCDDPDCSGDESGNIASPDTGGIVGWWTSVAVDAAGNPVVSYLDWSNFDLKVLHCGDPACTSGNSVVSPDTAGSTGWDTSLVLDGSGNPVISYYADSPNFELRVLHCDDPDCSGDESGNIASPDTTGWVGRYTSVALDGSGNPVVSYFDVDNFDLKVLHCGDPNCSSGNSINTLDTDGDVGRYTSVALDGSGNPVVSYHRLDTGDLKVLHCDDPNCVGGGETITSPDTEGNVGEWNSLALDGSGNPIIAYSDTTRGNLKVLHCGDANCASGNVIITPDFAGSVGWYPSLALDGVGNPVVSYYDGTEVAEIPVGDLKVLHCGDPNCTPAPVGGIAELPPLSGTEAEASSVSSDSSEWSVGAYVALAATAAVAVAAVAAGGWYARRRWIR